MSAQLVDRLTQVFRAVFELPPDFEVRSLRQLDARNWDSIAHVSLVTAIESDFSTSLDAADQLRMTSFDATAIMLEEKGL